MQIQHKAASQRENVPVASILLPKIQRKLLLIFYDYVRGLDNLADDASQTPPMRLQALSQVAHQPPAWAQPYFAACQRGDLRSEYGQQMMQAFEQDQLQNRYENWETLLGYCSLSAAPYGRCLLAIFAEDAADFTACDALCQWLQILNHLQDIGEDYRSLNRIYLPDDLMQKHGVSEAMLGQNSSAPPLRGLLDEILQRCEPLRQAAQHLPSSLRSRRLRIQARWVLRLAGALHQQLAQQDPLVMRVKPNKWQQFSALIGALTHGR